MVPLLLALSLLAVSASAQCLPGNATCLPSWEPTWDMMRSTVLYTCNNSGFHDVNHAVKFGTVVYDWSNAKQIWANAHPMNSEELITKQAEMVGGDRLGPGGGFEGTFEFDGRHTGQSDFQGKCKKIKMEIQRHSYISEI